MMLPSLGCLSCTHAAMHAHTRTLMILRHTSSPVLTSSACTALLKAAEPRKSVTWYLQHTHIADHVLIDGIHNAGLI